MYSPDHYNVENLDLIFEIIQKYAFATVISTGADGLVISHLPLLLKTRDGKKYLTGHCAKANPHWQSLKDGAKVTVLFHGPHAYVSPAWYKPKASNVPTWNYIAVHVEGTSHLVADATNIYTVLKETTAQFENYYATGWQLAERPGDQISKLMNGIVAFEIEILKMQGKFKLSQNQEDENRNNVLAKLTKMGDAQVEVAGYMNRVAQKSKYI